MDARQSLEGTAYGTLSSIVERQLSGKLSDSLQSETDFNCAAGADVRFPNAISRSRLTTDIAWGAYPRHELKLVLSGALDKSKVSCVHGCMQPTTFGEVWGENTGPWSRMIWTPFFKIYVGTVPT